jgi:hypothetical protein
LHWYLYVSPTIGLFLNRVRAVVPILVFQDNQSTVKLAKTDEGRRRGEKTAVRRIVLYVQHCSMNYTTIYTTAYKAQNRKH